MSNGSRRIRATVDTNLFVSAALRAEGNPARILTAWRQDRFRLVTSTALEDEVVAVFGRPQLLRRFRLPAPQQADFLLALVAAEHVMPLLRLPIVVRDPNDDMLLACALGGEVDYLVTGDDDLHALAGSPALGKLQIIAPRDFLIVLGIAPSRP